MAKSLDGIKKLNPAEAKQYRRIVLDYIDEPGAAAREKQKLSLSPQAPRRVDGLNLSELKKENSERQDRLNQAVKRQTEERERIKEEEKRHLLEKEREKKERRLKEREEIERLKKAKRAEEQRRWREEIESAELEETKRREELAKIKEERNRARRLAREKKWLERRRAVREFNKNLKSKFKKFFLAVKKNIVYILSLPAAALTLAYVIFCLAVLRFNQYDIIKQAANYLPVPAIITSQGIISYNDFRQIKTSDYSALNLAGKKDSLLKWAVLKNLREKYGSTDNLETKLAAAGDLDKVALSRIRKIKELLAGGEAMEQLGRYADEYNDGSYFDNQAAAEKFGQEVLNLAVGQASEIIFRPGGYYLIKRIEDKNGQLGFKYFLVGARTLGQYISDQLKNSKIFILAN